MPLPTHTRFNKDSYIESKSRRSTRYCFFIFFVCFPVSVELLSINFHAMLWNVNILFLLLFFHFLGPSMMNNFFFVALCLMRFIFYNGERCVFYGYENHTRDVPRDGIVIDYYVIPGNTAAFYQFTASFIFLCFSFNILHSLYNIITKSLLIFLLWFSVKKLRTVTAVDFVCSSRVFIVRTVHIVVVVFEQRFLLSFFLSFFLSRNWAQFVQSLCPAETCCDLSFRYRKNPIIIIAFWWKKPIIRRLWDRSNNQFQHKLIILIKVSKPEIFFNSLEIWFDFEPHEFYIVKRSMFLVNPNDITEIFLTKFFLNFS